MIPSHIEEITVIRYLEPYLGISVGLDGTCMLMKDDGRREAMTGTICFYGKYGERIHTIYTATPPEYGKQEFFKRFERVGTQWESCI